MATTALREQLSSYITRRVNAHAETAIDLYGQCIAVEWSEADKARLLLDTTEKLSKLGNKLPHKPYAENAQKISSLLKLGNIEEKPSHKAREGLREAVDQISEQLETEAALFGPTGSNIHTLLFALHDTDSGVIDAFKHPEIKVKAFDENTDFDDSCCLIISTRYKDSGLSFVRKIKETNPSANIIICGGDTFDNRLEASRNNAACFLPEPVQTKQLNTALELHFSIKGQFTPLVAVLDDSLSQLKYTESLLQKKGYQSVTFTDPALTFEVLDTYQPDVLLLDMYLPSCTGMDIARALQQHITWHNLPVIFLSAEDDPSITKEAQRVFKAPFLSKPANSKLLCNEIMQAIALRHQA